MRNSSPAGSTETTIHGEKDNIRKKNAKHVNAMRKRRGYSLDPIGKVTAQANTATGRRLPAAKVTRLKNGDSGPM